MKNKIKGILILSIILIGIWSSFLYISIKINQLNNYLASSFILFLLLGIDTYNHIKCCNKKAAK